MRGARRGCRRASLLYGRQSDERNVNSQHSTLATLLTCLQLATPVLAAQPRGCDAAWTDGASPRLVRLDETSAALKIGSLVIARARLGPTPALLQVMQPDVLLAATLMPAGTTSARWRVRGPIRFDDECTLEVDAEIALENPDAQTTRAARALAIFGQARAASEDAQPERAADLAQQALAESGRVADHPALAATIAAFSIERLIDQRQLGRARQLAEEVRPQIQATLDRAQPAGLRFELASLRLLAWPEALAQRERLQVQLDATFGPRSVPALENRVRYANNLLVL